MSKSQWNEVIEAVIGIYVVITISIFAYYYTQGGYSYRDADFKDTMDKYIAVFRTARAWPVNMFGNVSSGTSMIDGSNHDTFRKSLVTIIKQRQSFHDHSADDAVVRSLAYCIAFEYHKKYSTMLGTEETSLNVKRVFSTDTNYYVGDELLVSLRDAFHGLDFADAVAKGNACKEALAKIK